MKRVLWITMLLTVFMLAGCGPKLQPPVQAEQPPTSVEQPAQQPAAQPQEEQNPAAAELGREEKKDMVFMLEGMEETVPVTLHIGQGYSIYIPDEGWRLEKDMDDGIPEDTWESTVNHDVELRVIHLGEKTLEEAKAWVMAAEDDYRLIEDKQGGLGGTDPEDREMMEVRFYPSGSMMYAVLYEYPLEAAEGFGARLDQITATFEVMN